jgi:hypothetical protein
VVHWLSSSAPGVIAWLVLVLAEWLHQPTAVPTLLAPGAVVGLFVASTLPWAATVGLPRLTGGIVGVVLLALVVSMRPAAASPLAGLSAPPGVLMAAVCVAAAAVGGALAWIARADVPLETAQ